MEHSPSCKRESMYWMDKCCGTYLHFTKHEPLEASREGKGQDDSGYPIPKDHSVLTENKSSVAAKPRTHKQD